MNTLWTRRRVLQAAVALVLTGCQRRYVRPYGELYLGPVSALLYPRQFVRERAIVVFRDDEGWSALSTRCTYEGCELSYQEERLICLCCRSVFDFMGSVKNGPALDPLPWFEMRYGDGALYAVAGKSVESSYRFMTPELRVAIERVWERMQNEATRPGEKIPQELLGTPDPEFSGPIFQPQGKKDERETESGKKDREGKPSNPSSPPSTTSLPAEDDPLSE